MLHDDPLVVKLLIANCLIYHILVDGGSSANVMFLHCFSELRIPVLRLRPYPSPLIDFSGERPYPLGTIALQVTVGEWPIQVTITIDFVVIHASSSYNIILGRSGLAQPKAVLSTYYQVLKFPTKKGVGEVRCDQGVTQSCNLGAIKIGKIPHPPR